VRIMNNYMFLSLAVLICSCSLVFSSGSKWSYDGKNNIPGPAQWGEVSGECNKKSQSPINIVSTEAVVDANLKKFQKDQLTAPTSMKILNNGHSIKVSVEGGYTLPDGMGSLPGSYKAAQFHFHWGNPTGSEHKLDDTQYFGEMHIVHFNNKYADIGGALNEKDGLAVLGFFITNDAKEDNAEINKIINAFGSIPNADDETELKSFAIGNLVPANIDNFYRYSGSLTTPPCSETVVWTMFENKISISQAQAAKFLEFASVTNNFRPIQAKNGRVVSKNFGGNGGNAMGGKISVVAIITTLVVNLLLL